MISISLIHLFSGRFPHTYPMFTKYQCILITDAFRFLQMTVACDIIIGNFPLNIVYNAFFSLHQRKKNRNVVSESRWLTFCLCSPKS